MNARRRIPSAPVGVILIVTITLGALAFIRQEHNREAAYHAGRQEYEISKSVVPPDVTAHRDYTGDKAFREEWRAEQDLESQRTMATWSRWSGWATWLGVILLAATLWETTRTTIAAANAAEASQDAIDVARSTAKRQLRAYVAISGGGTELVNIIEGGLGIRVRVNLINSGQTPAYDFSTWSPPPLIGNPSDLPFTDATPLEDRPGRSITSSGQNADIEHVIPLSETQLAGLREGTKKLFLWGGADYTDVYGEKRYFRFKCINGAGLSAPATAWPITPHRLGYEASEQFEE
jgi:hypothetical protein